MKLQRWYNSGIALSAGINSGNYTSAGDLAGYLKMEEGSGNILQIFLVIAIMVRLPEQRGRQERKVVPIQIHLILQHPLYLQSRLPLITAH